VSARPIAAALAARVVAIRDGAVPEAVLARAHDLLRDYVGVALGGAGTESSVAVRRGLAHLGLRGDATVLGARARLPAPHAALANGAAAHALEMDDTHQAGSIHLGAPVFSAALAAAETSGAGGELVLRAAVAGYEVAGRLARALDPAAHYRRGFHPTGTCGAFGAAAAAGALLGLDAGTLTSALGIAGSQAAGLLEFLADGSWTKRFHAGWAACAGLHAAALAGAGLSAPATVVEGRFGFLHAYSDGADPAPLVADDGWEICRTSVKPHACCRYIQGPIDAVLALRAREGLEPARVARIEVGMLAAGFPLVCEPLAAKRRPASVVDAQFSLPFGVAVALAHGAASPAEYVPARFTEPALVALMDRVTPVRDPALDARYPAAWPCWVTAVLDDGRRLEARVDRPRGDAENFPTAEELDAKFRALAGRALAPDALARLAVALERVRTSDDLRALLAATTVT
jgi:2-methylcitrate dehydratase PrpD